MYEWGKVKKVLGNKTGITSYPWTVWEDDPVWNRTPIQEQTCDVAYLELGFPTGRDSPWMSRDKKSLSPCPFVSGQGQEQKSLDKLICPVTSRDKINTSLAKKMSKRVKNYQKQFFSPDSCPGPGPWKSAGKFQCDQI